MTTEDRDVKAELTQVWEVVLHNNIRVVQGTAVVSAALTVARLALSREEWSWRGRHRRGAVALAAVGSLSAGVSALASLEAAKHSERSCELCVGRRVDDAVGGGEERAQRLLWALRLAHWVFEYPRALSAVEMATSVGVLAVRRRAWARAVASGSSVAGIGWTTLMVWALVEHEYLMQWCPYCRHDDGDDEHESGPVPSLEIELPVGVR